MIKMRFFDNNNIGRGTFATLSVLAVLAAVAGIAASASIQEIGELRRLWFAVGSVMLGLVLATSFLAYMALTRTQEGHSALEKAHQIAASAREEARQLNEGVVRLNSELLEKIERLNHVQDEVALKGKLAQLGQLTATVAHEIRNPLGAIRTASYLIELKLKNKGMGVETQLQRIAAQVSRCDKIISELLDFTRSRALDRKAFNVDDWVRGIVEEERKSLPAMLHITYDFGLSTVESGFDEDRMRRVLINLLSNSSEAMVGKADAVTAVAALDPRINVATKCIGDVIEISVTDNGPGISEENMAKIMQPLFTTKSFGVGLGLPAVEKILQQHGGGLRIASTVGEGATFTAYFPIAEATRKAA